MSMNMLDWRNSIQNSNERKVIPVMTFPGLELTGKKIIDMVRSGEEQYLCVKALSERYPSNQATTLMMDLSVEAEVFGSEVIYADNEVPTITGRLLTDFETIDELKIPELGTGRTGEYLMAAQLSANGITQHPVFGGIIGPYSLAGRLFDITEFMMAILIDPEGAHKLLSICTDFLKKYAMGFKEAGSNGVLIAEPAAGLLAEDHCEEFSSKYVKEIVDHVQDDSFMVVLHNCGNTEELVDSMVKTGSQGFHFGNAVNMETILSKIPSDRIVMGNIDPANIIKNGNKELIRTKTMELLGKTSNYKNFILSSGCDIPPGTPLENIDTFFEALGEYNEK